MSSSTKQLIAAILLLTVVSDKVSGFTTSPVITPKTLGINKASRRVQLTHLYQTPEEQMDKDDEIERLRSMAQKLRADAAALEAERAEELASAAESVFRKFDTNKDGEISIEELKEGLEKALKIELTDKRVEQVMKDFDVSGDGKLQLDEMVTLDKFSNKLEALARDEKLQAQEAKQAAQKEAEAARLAEARLDLLNDKEPTTKDKIVSLLPYLFPLMDSLQFGRFLLIDNADNPVAIILAVLFALYRSVPFSGFIAFIALNILSSNPGLNRLVRFNMQQAIFLDIALFFPSLLAAAFGLVASGADLQIPQFFSVIGSDAIFASFLLVLGYCAVSSLLGKTPNAIPFVSKAVEDRMPTVDMFDDSGRFIPRDEKDDDEKKD